MPLQVLIVPDKFKGTLTAESAAKAMAEGWRKARPKDELDLLPMTDGGDGFGEVISGLLGGKPQMVETIDAAHRPCRSQWWWEARGKTAVVESARFIGLAMHPGCHPFDLDTYGLGAVLRAAAKKGARRCLVGIGGSATNDAGFGLALSAGWKFLNSQGMPLKKWTELARLYEAVPPPGAHGFEELIVAVDVQNPLLGARGCTRIYGPQKGLRPKDFPRAERALRRLVSALGTQGGAGFAKEPGAGAAGGLGFGFRQFLGAELQPGFDLFARLAGLERRLRSADLVITGEGALDRSSTMGKGVGEIIRLCAKARIPCIGLAGKVSPEAVGALAWSGSLVDLTNEADAMSRPADWLRKLAETAGRSWKP